MPYGDLWSAPAVMSWVQALSPASVLDVGVGFGQNGFLVRQTLELRAGRYHRADWRVRLDGVECFAAYRTPLWDYVYDQVHIGPIEERLADLPPYDLCLLCDVIEHFDKPIGQDVLSRLLDRCRVVIVTTPLFFFPQREAFGNERERHRSYFTPLDFRGVPHLRHVAGQTLLVLASRHPLPEAVRAAPLGSGRVCVERFCARCA